jgi:Transposase DDE domain group 1
VVRLDGVAPSHSLRRSVCRRPKLANAICGTIRRKRFKIGALVTISVRRVKLAMASGCSCQAVFATAHRALGAA